jgi:aspartate/methionine/tyrosine aminotransferase
VFSSRLPRELTPNVLSRAVSARRAAGARLLDLTETNPTVVGIPYPPGMLSSLGSARGLRYAPDPRGLATAREAIAAEYREAWSDASSERVVLTASTSEAYAMLFKLLCDPGDEVLVPQPSYPLFDLLTRLEAVRSRPYRLEYHGIWSIDRGSLEAALGPRTRAVLVVSPNNPTGSRLRAADREWLASCCAERDIAVISDEVFAGYVLGSRPDAVSFTGERRALTFVLGGLSKSAGLPQVKLAWILAGGPGALVQDALTRLDVIADTYLSVSTPVQEAAPGLIAAGRAVRSAIHARLSQNLGMLRSAVAGWPSISLLEPEGGWSAVLRVPATQSEEALVLRLLAEADVVVHPGYFFDFPHEAFLVLSLLPDPAVFAEASGRILAMTRESRS